MLNKDFMEDFDNDKDFDKDEDFNQIIEVQVVSSSIVAKFMVKEVPNGTDEAKVFGKKFEETYQKLCWIWQDLEWKEPIGVLSVIRKCPKCHHPILFANERTQDDFDDYTDCDLCHRVWHTKCCGTLMYQDHRKQYEYLDICDDCGGIVLVKTFTELMNDPEAIKIAIEFLRNDIRGLAPKTAYRKWYDGHYITAKPDLYSYERGYIEFKTYSISDYARAQCLVFSFVLGEPITLIGWNGKNFEKETIKYNGESFPCIPEDEFFLFEIVL